MSKSRRSGIDNDTEDTFIKCIPVHMRLKHAVSSDITGSIGNWPACPDGDLTIRPGDVLMTFVRFKRSGPVSRHVHGIWEANADQSQVIAFGNYNNLPKDILTEVVGVAHESHAITTSVTKNLEAAVEGCRNVNWTNCVPPPVDDYVFAFDPNFAGLSDEPDLRKFQENNRRGQLIPPVLIGLSQFLQFPIAGLGESTVASRVCQEPWRLVTDAVSILNAELLQRLNSGGRPSASSSRATPVVDFDIKTELTKRPPSNKNSNSSSFSSNNNPSYYSDILSEYIKGTLDGLLADLNTLWINDIHTIQDMKTQASLFFATVFNACLNNTCQTVMDLDKVKFYSHVMEMLNAYLNTEIAKKFKSAPVGDTSIWSAPGLLYLAVGEQFKLATCMHQSNAYDLFNGHGLGKVLKTFDVGSNEKYVYMNLKGMNRKMIG